MKQIKRRYLVVKCRTMTYVFHHLCRVLNRVGYLLGYPDWILRAYMWSYDWFWAYCTAWGAELMAIKMNL